jgi:hypothetical protein
MRHQEIILGLAGQTFFYDPPELVRPSGTPTVAVRQGGSDDSSAALSATTGACSVDSVDTTIATTVALAGDKSIKVASGTGIARNRRYLLTSVDGHCEQVEVASVSGVTVGLRHPLINDYAITTSTFQGTRISVSVLDSWAASTANLTDVLGGSWQTSLTQRQTEWAPGAAGYRLRWAYTVGGVATIGVSYADLVRYQAKNLVSALDVDRLFPNWIDRLPPDYRADQGAVFIDEAFQAVKMDALTDAQLLRRVRDTQVLTELVKYRANLLSVQNNVMQGGGDPNALALARDLYDQRYNSLIREPKVAVDQTGGGANGEAVRLPVMRR